MSKNNFKYTQVHLIPFDIGFMFYDVMSESNTLNIKFGKEFIKELIKCGYKDIKVERPYSTEETDKLLSSESKNDKDSNLTGQIDTNIAENEKLCIVKLSENLYCYISNIGVAIFILVDTNQKALIGHTNKAYGKLPVWMCVQKKITNEALMSSKLQVSDNFSALKLQKNWPGKDAWPKPEINSAVKDVLSDERKLMFKFQADCWDAARTVNKMKEFRFPCVRPYTSNPYFKNHGFSYSMNIMIGDLNKDGCIEYLLNGGAPKLKFGQKTVWEKANKHYNQIKDSCLNKKMNTVSAGPYTIYFSWSSIIVDTTKLDKKEKNRISDIKKLIKEEELMTLLYAELAIQARWFNADNCVNNSIENQYSKIENLQKLQGYIEYCSAQLENPTSSCASSLYLQCQQQIVKTSRIQDLYRSIIDRMKAQKDIKLGLNRKRNNKLILVTEILLGLFTGATVFKTFWDITNKGIQLWSILTLVFVMIGCALIQALIFVFTKDRK